MAEKVVSQANGITWKSDVIQKSLGSEKYTGEDGKVHTRRIAVQDVEYIWPVLDKALVQKPSDIVPLLEEILRQNRPGFASIQALVDHIAFGLYTNNRSAIGRGNDVRLTEQQRRTIKMYIDMVRNYGLPADQAIELLNKQGIPDAEQALQSLMDVEEEENSEAAD